MQYMMVPLHTAVFDACRTALGSAITITENPKPRETGDYLYLQGPSEGQNEADSHKSTPANEATYLMTYWSVSPITARAKFVLVADALTSRSSPPTIVGYTLTKNLPDGPAIPRHDPDAQGNAQFGMTGRFRFVAYKT